MKFAESCGLYRIMKNRVLQRDTIAVSKICKNLRLPQRTLSVSCYNFFAAKSECRIEPDDIILVSASVNLACRVCETARPVEKILQLAGEEYSIEVDQTTRQLYLDSVNKTEIDISYILDFDFGISEIYSRLEAICKKGRFDSLFSKRCWILLNDIMLTPLSIYFTSGEMVLASVFLNHLASLPEATRLDASCHSLFTLFSDMVGFGDESFPAVEFIGSEILDYYISK